MPHEFRLQDPGEGIHEAEIVEIKVAKGDRVREGDDVIVAETDKAAVDIPAPVSGVVREIRVAVGDIVEVGDVLIVFGDGDEDAADTDAKAKDEPRRDADGAARDDAEERAAGGDDAKKGRWKDRRDMPEPGGEAGAEEESGDEAAGEEGEGAGEVPGEADERARADVAETGRGASDGRTGEGERSARVRATPSVRGLARELGVDLSELAGSGEDGRILEQDVRSAAKAAEDARAEATEDAGDEVYELRSLRRTTARRMERAWREIPHVTHHDAVDITELERLRRKHAPQIAEDSGALTLTPFLVKALAIALPQFPDFNATFDAETRTVHRKKRIDIGVALDTERGLLVPVLRDAGQASIADLARRLNDLGDRLRGGSARAEDLRGATFTLTNVGAIGGTGLAPIINPPQTAIFGAARAELRQVVKGDLDDHRVEVALRLPVCLTFDHRVADGAQAARFVNLVRGLLGDPGTLMLHG